MIEQINLGLIDPNPYQTRMGEDAEHIRNLAISIADYGMLQIPAGRLVDENGEPVGVHEVLKHCVTPSIGENIARLGVRVQLAFGHSRMAAYRLLSERQLAFPEDGKASDVPEEEKPLYEAVKSSLENGAAYFVMEVNLTDLVDEEMFAQAVAENLDRKDLTPVEEAQAMATYRDQFKKTSPEIGELFHLSDSAVRNKLRLLKLPKEIQDQLQSGTVSERTARGIIGLFDLPEAVLQRANNQQFVINTIQPRQIIADALSGRDTSEATAEKVKRLIDQLGKKLSGSGWKLDAELAGKGIVSTTCRACEQRWTENNLCLNADCFQQKTLLLQRQYLKNASQASGYPIDEREIPYYSEDNRIGRWSWESEQATQLRASKCSNLAIRHLRDDDLKDCPEATLKDLGFPKAVIVCTKRAGFCQCRNGLELLLQEESRRKLEEARLAREAASVATAEPPAPQAEPIAPNIVIVDEEQGKGAPEEHIAVVIEQNVTAAEPEKSVTKPVIAPEPVTQPSPPSATDLQEIARADRARQRKVAQQVKKIKLVAGYRCGEALAQQNAVVWRELLYRYSFQFSREEWKGKEFKQLAQAMGPWMIDQWGVSDADYLLRKINNLLREAGLDEIVIDEIEGLTISQAMEAGGELGGEAAGESGLPPL